MKKAKYGAHLSSYQPKPKDPFEAEFISGDWDDNAGLANSIPIISWVLYKLGQSDQSNPSLRPTAQEDAQPAAATPP